MVRRLRAENLRRSDASVDTSLARYLSATGQLQKLMDGVVSALQEIGEAAGEIDRVASPHSLEVMGIAAVSWQNVSFRMSGRLMKALARLGVNGYGQLVWPPTAPEIEDWADQDRKLLENNLSMARRAIRGKAAALEAEASAE